jgi:hypothetical protein
MTKTEAKPTIAAVNELFAKSPDGLRELVRAVMQEMLEAEMTDAVGAEKGERTTARLSYRSGSRDDDRLFVETLSRELGNRHKVWLDTANMPSRGHPLRSRNASGHRSE